MLDTRYAMVPYTLSIVRDGNMYYTIAVYRYRRVVCTGRDSHRYYGQPCTSRGQNQPAERTRDQRRARQSAPKHSSRETVRKRNIHIHHGKPFTRETPVKGSRSHEKTTTGNCPKHPSKETVRKRKIRYGK